MRYSVRVLLSILYDRFFFGRFASIAPGSVAQTQTARISGIITGPARDRGDCGRSSWNRRIHSSRRSTGARGFGHRWPI